MKHLKIRSHTNETCIIDVLYSLYMFIYLDDSHFLAETCSFLIIEYCFTKNVIAFYGNLLRRFVCSLAECVILPLTQKEQS
jgi:hypothetical protein